MATINQTRPVGGPEFEQEQAQQVEDQEPEASHVEEESNPKFGKDLKNFLAELEAGYSDSLSEKDKKRAGRIRKAQEGLNLPEEGTEGVDTAETSKALAEVFYNMQAWKYDLARQSKQEIYEGAKTTAESHYYQSKKVFMQSCKELYPGVTVSKALAGSEIIQIERQLASLNQIPQLQQYLAEKPGLEGLAESTNDKLEKNPQQLISDLENVMMAIGISIEKALQAKEGDLTPEAQKQLDTCVREMYKFQLLIDQLKGAHKAAEVNAKVPTKEAKPELIGKPIEQMTTEEKQALAKNIEIQWQNLGENFSSIKEFLDKETYDHFDWNSSLTADFFGNFDQYKAEMLDEGLEEIWLDYRQDERSEDQKLLEYQIRISKLLAEIKGLK